MIIHPLEKNIKPTPFRLVLVFFSFFILSTINSSAQIINTIAGDTVGGYNGDSIQSTAAEIYYPYGVAVDSAGNVYIADWANCRIRKITIATGIITTIAGTGSAGYNGDNILAVNAELNFPKAVTVDHLGNVFIADATNGRIRRVDAITGMITTVAGTGVSGYNGDNILATTAKVNDPVGLAVDINGNIYIADLLNDRIRKVIYSTGMITTIAGTGIGGYNGDNIVPTSAELNGPSGVTLDPAGNIYIADNYNHRIRMISVSTGLIFTICGTGNQGYNGNNVPAITAQVNNPASVSFDPAWNLYIADGGNNLIRKIDHSTGLIHNVAGNLQSGYNGDGILATTASLNYPTGVAIDHQGNGYIADAANNRIRVVSNFTTEINTLNNLPVNINLYPNPFSNNATLSIRNYELGIRNGEVKIINLIGQEVKTIPIINHNTDPIFITIKRDNLPSGMYFYKLISDGKETVAEGKMVVE